MIGGYNDVKKMKEKEFYFSLPRKIFFPAESVDFGYPINAPSPTVIQIDKNRSA